MGNTSSADFIGKGWSFPPTFNNITGTVVMVEDEADIQQSLQILFNTEEGERVMQPKYRTGLRQFMFDTPDASKITYIKDLISNSILHFEPRIELNDIDLDVTNILDGVIYISLDYTIRSTNSRNNIVYPFYQFEGNLVTTTEKR